MSNQIIKRMINEDKNLLLKDLCGRLPYGVKVKHEAQDFPSTLLWVDTDRLSAGRKADKKGVGSDWGSIEFIKPYLRPMSSMTEEERHDLLVTIVGNEGIKYFQVLADGSIDNTDAVIQDLNKFNMHWINFDKDTVTSYLDWLNAHHFDFRNLIGRGLAIDCTGLNIY